jgi:hypothetical protein
MSRCKSNLRRESRPGRERRPFLVLLQYPDDLFFAVSDVLHRPSPSMERTRLQIEGNFGGAGRMNIA